MGGEDEAQECARRYAAAWTNTKGARSGVADGTPPTGCENRAALTNQVLCELWLPSTEMRCCVRAVRNSGPLQACLVPVTRLFRRTEPPQSVLGIVCGAAGLLSAGVKLHANKIMAAKATMSANRSVTRIGTAWLY